MRPPAGSGVGLPANEAARIDVDLHAIRDNVHRLRRAAGRAEVMAVVKADAYGHGLVPVSRAARRAGAGWLGVAQLSEAGKLRAAGDEGPVLAWLFAPGEDFESAIRNGIDLGVGAPWMLRDISAAAAATDRPARVHLKVDTGLGRNGVPITEWPALLAAAAAEESRGVIEIVGIWSHFAFADSPGHATVRAQLALFNEACDLAETAGIRPPLRHLANSAATFALPEAHLDLVRPGISVYGISPGPEVGTGVELGLRPAMTLSSPVALTKRVPAGSGVSYGHEYVTDRETTLALLPLGYADGVHRRASNRGPVWLAGARRRVAGRICMDQFVVDVGGDPCVEGDVAVLFGPGDRGEPTVEEWADACDTIPYEVVTSVGPRIRRVYRGEA